MSLLVSLLVSVMASIIGYYVCKWLDRNVIDR
jgi:membrane protein DedA with SNARE-associated domain